MCLYKKTHTGVPRQTGTDSTMVVEGDGHSVTGTANGYSAIALPRFDGIRKGMGVVSIITTFGAVSTEIHDLMAFAKKV